MYMNVFRSRKRDDYDAAAYAEDAARMGELARRSRASSITRALPPPMARR
jgi:hypothetical protein